MSADGPVVAIARPSDGPVGLGRAKCESTCVGEPRPFGATVGPQRPPTSSLIGAAVDRARLWADVLKVSSSGRFSAKASRRGVPGPVRDPLTLPAGSQPELTSGGSEIA